jgi:esterase/lipase superfamily enzyme
LGVSSDRLEQLRYVDRSLLVYVKLLGGRFEARACSMASSELGLIVGELIRFFSARSRTRGQVITSRTNVRQVCGFTDKPTAWMQLTKQINALPNVRKAGLYLTPADMAHVATVAQIARTMRKRSIVRKKAARKSASGRTRSVRQKSKAPSIVIAKKGVRSFGRKSVAGPRSQNAKEALRNTNDNADYTVWFGTNRKPNDSESLQVGFSKSRDTKIHYGYCRVFIPKSHKIGSTGSSWWQRLRSGIDDRLKLIEIKGMVADNYWSAISSRLGESEIGERDAVIFVHGYNVSFENAAVRAAQIGFDLSVKGAMAFFSWPSRGALKGYSADEATIEASEPFIAEFIEDFVARSGAEKVHIIAHSMGNRGVLRAIDRIANKAQKRTAVLIGQIILAAADVDADTFRDLCGAYGRVSRRTTLYVSARDRAVEASRWLHDFARAGLLPPITIVPGIDTINVTNVDLTALGHGYVADARAVLEDMHELLVHDAPPDRRFALRQGETDAGGRYWIIGR